MYPAESDVSHIKGNASDSAKRKNQDIFRRYAVGDEGTYAYSVGSKIVYSRLDVGPHPEVPGKLEARVVFKLALDESMLWSGGTMATGCIEYLADICTSMALVALGIYSEEQNRDPTAFAQTLDTVTLSLSVVHHAPAQEGAELDIITHSVTSADKSHTMRWEIWDLKKTTLIASGIHVKSQPSSGKFRNKL